ncbi:MAG: hypothetical protein MjAS7_1975 [Metallosphaera javensis (ex Sakai et al. 2022)]|nr:MAG: hypothetical protein MjAS7_1975 [Metallosphaera javensis (ex Sakai et al. 2022)]
MKLLFQTLKGSLQTLKVKYLKMARKHGFKPSKDLYKLDLANSINFALLSFKPSKDLYKPDPNNSADIYLGNVSNPQRISTNQRSLKTSDRMPIRFKPSKDLYKHEAYKFCNVRGL